MSTLWQVSTRLPQQGDGPELLLARLLTTHLRETVIPNSSANATRSTGVLTARGFRGMLIHLDITAYGGGGGILPAIDAEDPTTGRWATLVTLNGGGWLTGPGNYVVSYGPGVGAGTGGTVLSDRGGVIPERYRITITHSTSHAHFYSVATTLFV